MPRSFKKYSFFAYFRLKWENCILFEIFVKIFIRFAKMTLNEK